jgi:hypothetical protein
MRNRSSIWRVPAAFILGLGLVSGIAGCGAGPVSNEVAPVNEPPQGPAASGGSDSSQAPQGAQSAPSGGGN